MPKININDRVRRLPFTVVLPVESEEYIVELNGEAPVTSTSHRGCIGTVKAIREETSASTNPETRERSLMIHVQWDNGTLSYLGPEGIEVVN